MNTLKSVMVVGALAVVGYGVYAMLNNSPPPPGAPPWPTQAGGDASPLAGQPAAGQPNVSLGAPASPPGSPAQPLSNYVPAAPANPPPLAATGPSAAPPGPAPNEYASAYQRTSLPGNPTASQPAPSGSNSLYGQPPAGQLNAAMPPVAGAQPLNRYDAAAAGQLSERVPTAEYARSIPPALRTPAPTDAMVAPPTVVFETVMATAKAQLDRGQLDPALLTLSGAYDDPRLTDRQHEQLNDLLDQVAGTVIYSRKFPVGKPHRVAPGEKLIDIAQKYSIPPGLLAKINGLNSGAELTTGQELKVVQGPFMAQVNVPKRTLTLIVEGRYAGRFPISLGEEFKQIQGSYTIASKNREHVRYDGQRYLELKPAGTAPTPPVTLAIVGMTDPTNAERGQAQGLIAVSPKNADDLYDILSQGSQVTIRR
ncbi:MAG: LysM peptidoglycan-binding domain-containing protein [Planctomycetes bacterium]|nr:LysM peptidoglycan-binding domain-containing protein [Planctomycetota bacterium]